MNYLYEFTNNTITCNLFNKNDISLSIPKQHLGFHCHRGIEILYVHEGSGHFIIDKKTYPYHDKTLVIFNPLQIHGIFPDKNSNIYHRSIIVFEPNFVNSYSSSFPKLSKFISYLSKGQINNPILYDDNDFINLFCEVTALRFGHNFEFETNEASVLFIQTILNYMLDYKDNFINPNNSDYTTNLTNPYISKILGWVEKNYNKIYSLDELAQSLSISKYHVTHVFKKQTGTTIGDYVIQCRIRESKILLQTTSLNIAAISEKIGFSTPSYFCNIFKSKTGFTPNQYRLMTTTV